MEHRWGQRRDVNRAVHLQTRSGVVAQGRITNVSMSGAFVVSPLPARLYSYVEVQFNALQHGRRTRVTVEGQVVRRGTAGFGIEWCEIDPEAIRALANRPIEVPQALSR
jgi:hypothetical protein